MEIAEKIHKCISNGSDPHDLLNLLNEIRDKNTLAYINEFFVEKYHKTPHEFFTEKFKIEELYAISSTLQYIREPSSKNSKERDKFYKKIGYSLPQ